MREVENLEASLGVGLTVAAAGMIGIASAIGDSIGAAIAQGRRNKMAAHQARVAVRQVYATKAARQAEADALLDSLRLARLRRKFAEASQAA